MTEERADRQRELLTPFVQAADVVITTAAVPGRQAPVLLTAQMLTGMKPGSVVVDLAAESGGNVEGAIAGQDVEIPLAGGAGALGSITLVGMKDAASAMPADASRLYAKNVLNLLLLMIKDGVLVLDFDDEVIAGACLTHDGAVRHQPTAALLGEPVEPVDAIEGNDAR
jgi:H+-translocating NAD(P) transhydrogenase subunit alpha